MPIFYRNEHKLDLDTNISAKDLTHPDNWPGPNQSQQSVAIFPTCKKLTVTNSNYEPQH